eukprot:gene13397-14727_t
MPSIQTQLPTSQPSQRSYPTSYPTMVTDPNHGGSSNPTISVRPSRSPTRSPTKAPKATSSPSYAPSRKPSLTPTPVSRPTVAPSIFSRRTINPTSARPSARPSRLPTRTPTIAKTLSSSFVIVDLTDENVTYVLSSSDNEKILIRGGGTTQLIANTSSSASVTMTVKRAYVIFPTGGTIILDAFNPTVDIIDVTRIPLLTSRQQFSYVTHPLSLTLPSDTTSSTTSQKKQKLLFPRITAFEEVPDSCFVYATSDSSSSSVVVEGGWTMLAAPALLIPLAVLTCCVLASFLFNYTRDREKEEHSLPHLLSPQSKRDSSIIPHPTDEGEGEVIVTDDRDGVAAESDDDDDNDDTVAMMSHFSFSSSDHISTSSSEIVDKKVEEVEQSFRLSEFSDVSNEDDTSSFPSSEDSLMTSGSFPLSAHLSNRDK